MLDVSGTCAGAGRITGFGATWARAGGWGWGEGLGRGEGVGA